MRRLLVKHLLFLGAFATGLCGCVTAKSLAPLAAQNQQNLVELRLNVAACTTLAAIVV